MKVVTGALALALATVPAAASAQDKDKLEAEARAYVPQVVTRSEEHTSELQSH